MKILIIGGAGFIGSHLCEAYIKDNNVTSLDNYISGKKENHIPGVRYLNMDAKDILSIDPVYQLIFHLGEYSRVEKSLNKLDFVLENNSLPILNVLKFTKASNAKLIYAGSSTKFADNGTNKFKSPYAFSKWQNSEIVKFYCENLDIPYAIPYFYNVYGGRENASGEFATVIAKFLNLKSHHKKLYITKPGTQTRNFTHIDDTVNALEIIADKGLGDEYGIANPHSYSINEVAQLISSNIGYLDENKANRQSSKILTEKTLALGWKPQKHLREYIKSKL
jgi:UDP-glucose 4-epimerase